jgi:hypothetical protein
MVLLLVFGAPIRVLTPQRPAKSSLQLSLTYMIRRSFSRAPKWRSCHVFSFLAKNFHKVQTAKTGG